MKKKQNGLVDAVKIDDYCFMAIANMTNVLCYIETNRKSSAMQKVITYVISVFSKNWSFCV